MPTGNKKRQPADAISHLLEESDVAVNVALVKLSAQVDAITEDYRDLRSEVGGVGKRVDDLSSAITTKIETVIQSINNKLEEKGKPNWQALLMAGGFIGAAFFAFINPLERTMDRIDNEQKQFAKDTTAELNRRSGIFVTTRELSDLKARVDLEVLQRRELDHDLQLQVHRLEDRFMSSLDSDVRKMREIK